MKHQNATFRAIAGAAAAILFLALASACSSHRHPGGEVGVAYPEDLIEIHTVTGLNRVPMDRTSGRVGSRIGSMVGGFGGTIGSIAGGILGPVTEKVVTRRKANEFTLRSESGEVTTILQMPDDHDYAVGQQVQVLKSSRNGTAIVRPLDGTVR